MKILTAILLLCFATFVLYNSLFRKRKQYVDQRDKNYIPQVENHLSEKETELLRLINEYRISIGLNELIPEKLACNVCYDALQEDITQGENASHTGWEKRIEMTNGYGAEILANNYLSPSSMFSGYLKSPKHKSAIELKYATHIGLAIVNRNNYCLIIKYTK